MRVGNIKLFRLKMRKRAGIGAIHKKKVDAEKFKYEKLTFTFLSVDFFSYCFSLRREKSLAIYIYVSSII